ncbi:Hpt domain-containing protein [Pleomorphomonas sp. JP5]|uniref:Hpt domain-containing protein n=1 Tax=Pleomorphomonas sp. JP5 TaxID=2942998 RepID=UPI002043551E|nr:Hpt domain-containing protein [Pleomorphomonas sp. JP5]MCM5559506.1 Hpt domain-containing protein [Pleomorphomonas sp. JP5]
MNDDERMNGSPIDLRHLAEQTFGNAELEAEVLRLFLKQSRDCLDRLSATPDAGIAHLLLGSARGIGARAVAEAASALESALLRGSDGGADLVRLREAVAAATAFVEARLGGRG